MDFIEQVLNNHFSPTDWKVYKTKKGKSKESFIAESNDRKVFIKLDVSTMALDILSNLGIAPKVLASGEYSGRSYIIQEFIQGVHPDSDWINSHLQKIGTLIQKYHSNTKLKDTLALHQTTDYRDHLDHELHELENNYSDAVDLAIKTPATRTQLDMLSEYSHYLQRKELVPAHADTNHSNFIINDSNIYMIDWDDVVLSDEMKDISLFCWIYIEKKKWNEFMHCCGVKFDRNTQMRFYWWLTQGLLSISFWFEKRKDTDNIKTYLNQSRQAMEHLKLLMV